MGYALNTILANQLISRIVPHVQPIKKLISYDLPNLSSLPPGQQGPSSWGHWMAHVGANLRFGRRGE